MATALTVAALVPSAPTAPASTDTSQPVITIEVGLKADCSTMPRTKFARDMAARYHVCEDALGGGLPGVIVPQTYVDGNCGRLRLDLYNFGAGYVLWKGEITSSLGPFVLASYVGSWSNWSAGQGGVSRTYAGLTSDWVDTFLIYTRAGLVSGQIYFAKDFTFWGLSCTSTAIITSNAYVTM